jgi:spore germination protein KA
MNIISKLYKSQEHMPDLQIKKINYLNDYIFIINLQSVSSSNNTNDFILRYLSNANTFISSIKIDILNNIPSISYKTIKEKDIFNYLFNGFTILIYKDEIISFETKNELDRSITESTSEPTVKGPKDSFNENYNTNIGLIRKRIKDENLYFDEITLGKKSKTKISIIYMNDIVNKELLNNVKHKIKSIKSDKVFDTYYIKELIRNENNTLIPTIKSTEKPSVIAKVLSEGKICILSENSNSLLIIPTFFIDYFYNDEDNYQKKLFVYFVKIIRLLALFITIFAPSIYLSLITYDEAMLPTDFLINFSIQRSGVPFPALIEAFILMITFELLYEADALTPTTRGTSLSILGALVLGDAAVSAGIVSPIMVIVVAITAISSIIFTYQDFQSFIRFYRYLIMLLSSIFGMIGIFFGLLFLLTNLCSIKTFNRPFILLNNFKSKRTLIKKGLINQNTDKSI